MVAYSLFIGATVVKFTRSFLLNMLIYKRLFFYISGAVIAMSQPVFYFAFVIYALVIFH
ncbi:hypothetical protein GMES_1989 [Paraglaciecola mesophila KMM 241]|uniref:Uncharacterized protein n=1 Tax=Paraglaciecola mesophila KMM 241 TaxID=1128912 RepID=K6ZLR7_9ALTE|nr:hypothetical protein GMES_1989 [Paraglaciecola mesophila KMM 241]